MARSSRSESVLITPAMAEAGGRILADVFDAPTGTARTFAAEVFRAMCASKSGSANAGKRAASKQKFGPQEL